MNQPTKYKTKNTNYKTKNNKLYSNGTNQTSTF